MIYLVKAAASVSVSFRCLARFFDHFCSFFSIFMVCFWRVLFRLGRWLVLKLRKDREVIGANIRKTAQFYQCEGGIMSRHAE